MKPNPFIFLIGNNVICALLLIALLVVVIDSWQGELQQNLLIISSLFVLAIYSLYANRRVTAYKNFQDKMNAIRNDNSGGKQHKPLPGSQKIALILLWLTSVYTIFTVSPESNSRLFYGALGIFILSALWGCYLLLRTFPGLAASLFKRGSSNSQGHTPKDYIVSHSQAVPKSAAAATQINQQLPGYCKSLLERK